MNAEKLDFGGERIKGIKEGSDPGFSNWKESGAGDRDVENSGGNRVEPILCDPGLRWLQLWGQ